MTTATAPRLSAGAGLSRMLAVAGLALAILALLVLAAGPIGWRAGLWHYRIGLGTLMPAAGCLGVGGLALSAAALLAALRGRSRRDIAIALLGMLIAAGVAYFPWHWSNQRSGFARVNDVTTDFAAPPSLAFSEAMRKAEEGNPAAYAGEEFAGVQRRAYPDIAPARLAMPLAAAFEKVLALVRARGWTIVAADPAAGIIDAYDRSFWFGFTDDIAVRVTSDGEDSRVDIRSGARQGHGDYGVNARRVRAFLAALNGR
jgi:uncharacterized protein (DUF1499 family)